MKSTAPDKTESRAEKITSASRAEKTKSAVIDASSAILLAKAGLLAQLAKSFRLAMVSSVISETTRPGYPGAKTVKELREGGGIVVVDSPATDASMDSALGALHAGERDTIVAWLQGAADFVIIDDGKGAGFCRDNAIPYINALLVPKILVASGRMPFADGERFTEAILALGRYSAKIVHYARTCSPESLGFFYPSAFRAADVESL